MGFNYLFIFPPCYVALCASMARHRLRSESISWCLETSLSFKTPFLGRSSIPTSFASLFIFCLSFYLLYFFLPPFEDNGCFSVCLMSSASIQKLLWNFLSIQMFFWWICRGESGLPVLSLRYLRTTPVNAF